MVFFEPVFCRRFCQHFMATLSWFFWLEAQFANKLSWFFQNRLFLDFLPAGRGAPLMVFLNILPGILPILSWFFLPIDFKRFAHVPVSPFFVSLSWFFQRMRALLRKAGDFALMVFWEGVPGVVKCPFLALSVFCFAPSGYVWYLILPIFDFCRKIFEN